MSYPITEQDQSVLTLANFVPYGDIIPSTWYKHILLPNGKPAINAILLLADIVYWYRPIEVRDEQTGRSLGLQKKFKADAIQRDYADYREKFGFTNKQIRYAFEILEGFKLVQREFRTIELPHTKLGNVMFILLNASKVLALSSASTEVTPPIDLEVNSPIYLEVTPSLPRSKEAIDLEVNTCTENTNIDFNKDMFPFSNEKGSPSDLFPNIQKRISLSDLKQGALLLVQDKKKGWELADALQVNDRSIKIKYKGEMSDQTFLIRSNRIKQGHVVYRNGCDQLVEFSEGKKEKLPQEVHDLHEAYLKVTERGADDLSPRERVEYWDTAKEKYAEGVTPQILFDFKENYWNKALYGWVAEKGNAVKPPTLDDIRKSKTAYINWKRKGQTNGTTTNSTTTTDENNKRYHEKIASLKWN